MDKKLSDNELINDILMHYRKKTGKYYVPKDINNKVFVKVDNFWWELDITTPIKSATIYNMGMGKNTDRDVSELEICEAKDWTYLNWEGTKILDNNLNTGWLDRQGNFYGCDYRYHRLQAELIHNADEETLEYRGYVKITKTAFHGMRLEAVLPSDKNYKLIRPTAMQMNYLNSSDIENLEDVKFMLRIATGEVENEM